MATYHLHNIPWELVSNGLERRCYTIQQDVSSDSYNRRRRKGNGERVKDIQVCGIFPVEPQPDDHYTQLQKFVEVFSDTIEEYTKMELEQYPDTYASIEDDDIIIDDQSMKNIADYTERWRKDQTNRSWVFTSVKRTNNDIGLEQRKTSAFCTPYVLPTACHEQADAHSHFQMEIVKSLLIRGEMHTLLRMCCHPQVNYFIRSWKYAQFDADCDCRSTPPPEAGWNQIYIIALHSFICINILKQVSHTWHCIDGSHESHDYKSLDMYQHLINAISYHPPASSFHLLSHRQFFGIYNRRGGETTTSKSNWRVFSYPPSAPTIQRGLDKTRYSTDLRRITELLSYKGLPGELIDDILQRAGYHAPDSFNFSVTSQADDPLSPEHAHLLDYYLEMCWDLIIRCSVMLEVLGKHDRRGPRKHQPSWQGTIARILRRLVPGVPHELIKDCQNK